MLESNEHISCILNGKYEPVFVKERCQFDCLFFFPSMNLDFLGGSVKNLPAVQETWVQSLGQEDPLEKGSDELNGSLASVNSQG